MLRGLNMCLTQPILATRLLLRHRGTPPQALAGILLDTNGVTSAQERIGVTILGGRESNRTIGIITIGDKDVRTKIGVDAKKTQKKERKITRSIEDMSNAVSAPWVRPCPVATMQRNGQRVAALI